MNFMIPGAGHDPDGGPGGFDPFHERQIGFGVAVPVVKMIAAGSSAVMTSMTAFGRLRGNDGVDHVDVEVRVEDAAQGDEVLGRPVISALEEKLQ